MKITVDYLEEIQESNKLSIVTKEVINILLLAINDWPRSIIDIDEYEIGILELLGGEVDKDGLEEYMSKIDFSKNAWEAESLSQLIEVYNFYSKEKKIRYILEDMRREVIKISNEK